MSSHKRPSPKQTPPRFIVDLRKNSPPSHNGGGAPPPPPPPPPPHISPRTNHVAALEQEISQLKESQDLLVNEVRNLRLQMNHTPSNSHYAPRENGRDELTMELEQTKAQLRKLKEDHKMALELIIALGASYAQTGSEPPKSHGQKLNDKTPTRLPRTPELTVQQPPFVPSSGSRESFNSHALGINKASAERSTRHMLDASPKRSLPDAYRSRIGESPIALP